MGGVYSRSTPPRIEWTTSLVKALSDAVIAIGRLAGEWKRLPNPYVLIRPFVKREAALSSRIEGTLATLGELLAAEAGATIETATFIPPPAGPGVTERC